MPPRKKHESAPPVSGADPFGALPDPMLQHILSFLPAQAAVRTCVLARRWRHIWRSTRGLRIVGLKGAGDVQDLHKFVDHLLILRDRTDLDAVEIRFSSFSVDDEAYVNLWTRFAVMCRVRALTLHISASSYLDMDDLPLISENLAVLKLDGVGLQQRFLDFAGCPKLEVLKMTHCDISVDMISSRSLKHLRIRSCRCNFDRWVHVSTPGLVSFVLYYFEGAPPFLENMPVLETARVDLSYDYDDFYSNSDSDENFDPISKYDTVDCVLLGGLSSAKHLELTPASKNLFFGRDLKQCPTFSKLKTLLLNEHWCDAADLDPLACILKKSPVLEKLTLQLFTNGRDHKVKMKGSYSSAERSSAISEHLNTVEVQCNVVNEKVLEVLKFLCAFNIRFSFE